jgi:hypothetical protein
VPFHVLFLVAGAVERSRLELEATVGRMARNALGDDLSTARYIIALGEERKEVSCTLNGKHQVK